VSALSPLQMGVLGAKISRGRDMANHDRRIEIVVEDRASRWGGEGFLVIVVTWAYR